MRPLLSPGDELGGEADEKGFTVESGDEEAGEMVDDPKKKKRSQVF
jgi:hypothetical protein